MEAVHKKGKINPNGACLVEEMLFGLCCLVTLEDIPPTRGTCQARHCTLFCSIAPIYHDEVLKAVGMFSLFVTQHSSFPCRGCVDIPGTEYREEALRRDSIKLPVIPYQATHIFLSTRYTPGSISTSPFRVNTTPTPLQGQHITCRHPAPSLSTHLYMQHATGQTSLPIYPDLNDCCHPQLAHSPSGH